MSTHENDLQSIEATDDSNKQGFARVCGQN